MYLLLLCLRLLAYERQQLEKAILNKDVKQFGIVPYVSKLDTLDILSKLIENQKFEEVKFFLNYYLLALPKQYYWETMNNPKFLCLAIKSKNFDIVELLIKLGADVNRCDEPDPRYYTGVPKQEKIRPLSLAVQTGQKMIVKLLIDAGANINVDSTEKSPLMYALHDLEMTKLLVNSGADINFIYHSGTKREFRPPDRIEYWRAGISRYEYSCAWDSPYGYDTRYETPNVVASILCNTVNNIVHDKAAIETLKFLLSIPKINTEQLVIDMGYTCTELTAYQMAKKRNLSEAVQAFDEYYKNKPKK